MQSESSAQRIPSAGSGEQAEPNGRPAVFGSTQVSWKPSPVDSSGPSVQVRRPQRESAPDSGNWFEGRPTLSCPQKLIGHWPPPAASAGQLASGRGSFPI